MSNQPTLMLSWQSDGRPRTREVTVGQIVTIGRLPECEVHVNDQQVSRQHAQVTGRLEAGRAVFEIKNLSHTNTVDFVIPAHLPVLETGQVLLLPEQAEFLLGATTIAARLVAAQAAAEAPAVKMVKVRCANCRELVDASLKDCPWCGETLAFGGTIG